MKILTITRLLTYSLTLLLTSTSWASNTQNQQALCKTNVGQCTQKQLLKAQKFVLSESLSESSKQQYQHIAYHNPRTNNRKQYHSNRYYNRKKQQQRASSQAYKRKNYSNYHRQRYYQRAPRRYQRSGSWLEQIFSARPSHTQRRNYRPKTQRHYENPAKTRHLAAQFATRPGTGEKVFVFDPKHNHWFAYNEAGKLINIGRASGGKHYCADVKRACRTPAGSFRVHRKGDAYCKSSKFPLGKGGAPMPYCMFFYHGFAVHGSYDVPNYNASHGCVRVKPAAAKWLHENFIRHGTRVIVRPYSS